MVRSGSAPASRCRAWLRGLARGAGRRLYISASQEQGIVNEFRKSYLGSGVESWWMGVQVSASPLDLWVYQEILHEIQAEVVVVVASRNGRYLASICQMRGSGEVLSTGTVAAAIEGTAGRKSVMVVIGTDSGDDNLAEKLAVYSPLVTAGSYLIVEDTRPDRAQTVEAFLTLNRDFTVDHTREKFYFTLSPGGFLRRH